MCQTQKNIEQVWMGGGNYSMINPFMDNWHEREEGDDGGYDDDDRPILSKNNKGDEKCRKI